MELTQEQAVKLKEIQREMLKTFIEICEAENLTYWLVGGTALGAVRHKGFIPWDDDIDVGMPRKDYDRFMEIGQSRLPEYYFLQNIDTDPEYPICFAKIRDSRTTYIESSAAHLNMNHGAWVDIFPHDGFPDNPIRKSITYKIDKIMQNRIGKKWHYADEKITVKSLVADVLAMAFFPSVKRTVRRRIKLMTKYPFDQSEFIRNYSGAWGIRETQPRENLGMGADGVFEGLRVKLPAEYDKYLTAVYGDYMTLPPEEKRVSHHYADIIDLERSYLFYTSK